MIHFALVNADLSGPHPLDACRSDAVNYLPRQTLYGQLVHRQSVPRQQYKVSTYQAEASIGYLVRRANCLMMDIIEPSLERRGLTFLQYIILKLLREGKIINPKDICGHFRSDSGALTKVIDQLAERELLQRVRRDRDRRKVELRLTERGRTLVDSILPSVLEKLNLALAEFSSQEARELTQLLTRLNSRMEAILQQKQPVAVAS
jgi:DNA-binding MarR family transcriptional regulator